MTFKLRCTTLPCLGYFREKSIPAFIDEQHDDYDQVIENLQHDDLKPMELALFIQKRLDLGDKKGNISKQLGKGNAVITHHLALINASSCIQEIYQSGRCTSPKSHYSLRSLYEKYGEAVEIWCKFIKKKSPGRMSLSYQNP